MVTLPIIISSQLVVSGCKLFHFFTGNAIYVFTLINMQKMIPDVVRTFLMVFLRANKFSDAMR